jgi:hypothetical protein
MYDVDDIDNGVCAAEAEGVETSILEKKFIEKDNDSYAFV